MAVRNNRRNANQRHLEDDSLEMNIAYSALVEYLEIKKKQLRRLINDPSKVAFARSIQQAHIKLQKEVLNSRLFIDAQLHDKVINMIYNFKKLVQFLLNSDSNLMIDNTFNYNLLDTAIITGSVDLIKNFINVGFNINSTYDSPMHRFCVPLHRAAENNQTKVIELLIQHGVDINMTNHHGKTALFCSARAGDTDTVQLLLKNNAQITDPDILTAGILSKSFEVIKLLLLYGADANQRDLCGRVPLHFVTGNQKRQSIQLRHDHDDSLRAEIAKLLIQFGAHVNAKSTSEITPLHAAAIKGYSQVAEALLINGASVDLPFSDNRTALFYASHNANFKVVDVLLKHGANINILDAQGRSVLNMAHTAGITNFVVVCNKFEPNIDIILKPINSLQNGEHGLDYNHFDVSHCIETREKIIGVLQQHIVKMISAGMFVRDEVKYQINMQSMESFKQKCEEELDMMSKQPLVNHLTGFDLMKMNVDSLAIYTRNPDIRDVLDRYNYSEKFPLYGIIIKSRIQTAIKRRVNLAGSINTLETMLHLPGYAM